MRGRGREERKGEESCHLLALVQVVVDDYPNELHYGNDERSQSDGPQVVSHVTGG